MRELKFRVWDNLKKEWLKKKVYHSSINVNTEGIGEFAFKQHPEGYTIQQFTGLQDKDGTDIFEGDILFFEPQDGVWSDQLDRNIEVVYPFICRNAHLAKVIGNIFDNPELRRHGKT